MSLAIGLCVARKLLFRALTAPFRIAIRLLDIVGQMAALMLLPRRFRDEGSVVHARTAVVMTTLAYLCVAGVMTMATTMGYRPFGLPWLIIVYGVTALSFLTLVFAATVAGWILCAALWAREAGSEMIERERLACEAASKAR